MINNNDENQGSCLEQHSLKDGRVLEVKSFGSSKKFPFQEDIRYYLDGDQISGLSEFMELMKLVKP
ncbi:hypothetical protein [Sphingobacterium multivorum]|uniref:hypothetical protein n=1 Tax=Sphingobacterium multivorum TaxID=28454 RepID=UPI0031BB9070